MERTRVLLLEIPAMLADLLKGIVQADDQIDIVGGLADAADLIEVSDRADANVVILNLPDGDLPDRAARCSASARGCA